MDPRIVAYYKLCTAANGRRSHVINDVRDSIKVIMTADQQKSMFEERAGKLIPRETIIGGADDPNHNDNPNTHDSPNTNDNTHSIIVYCD